jgi:hypothetical protein
LRAGNSSEDAKTEISSAHNWTPLLNAACKNVEGLLGDLWLSGN